MRYGYGLPIVHGFWWGGAFSGLLSFLFFLLIIALFLRLIRHGHHDHYGRHWRDHGSMPSKTAHDILAERYAKGEITKAEYDSMKKDISV